LAFARDRIRVDTFVTEVKSTQRFIAKIDQRPFKMIGRRGPGGLWMLVIAWLSVQGVLAGFLDVEMEP
jgi:hypothetical protein